MRYNLNMFKLIKNNKYKILVGLIIIGIIVYEQLIKSSSSTNVPIPKEQAKYQDLAPGTSTRSDVINKLGEPASQTTNTLNYKSSAAVKTNDVIMQGDTVKLIKEVVTLEDNKNVSDIKDQYGEPEYMLYGPRQEASFYLYIYPEKGIAYIGSEDQTTLLEIWYFAPTTIEQFKVSIAPDYSNTPSSSYY
jgi:hypothetical protein